MEESIWHFLLCMEQKVTLATLHRPEEFESFFKFDFPIFIAEAELPTDLYRQHFNVIKERFFSYDKITAWINYLGSRRTSVHNEQLYMILSFISNIALESILYGHDQAGFQPQTEFWIALQKTVNNDPLKAMFDVINEAEEEQVDIIMELSSRMLQQMNLLMYCNLGENAKLINWGYFSSGFPSEYVDNLQRLVYPRWYAASFMERFPESTSLWGHYADSHKGACLIYDFEKSTTNKELYIELERPKGITSSGTDKGYTPTYLKKVYYSNNEIQVDFFKRLWTQPHYIVICEWYTSDDGQKSPLISETNPDEETRLAYWDKLIKIQTTKTEDWIDENEYRLLIDDSFHDFSEPQSRVLKYKFNSLVGIVFGIRTPIEDKARIIEVIFSKCNKNGQQDFPFYQARYDKEQNIVVYDELSLLNSSKWK